MNDIYSAQTGLRANITKSLGIIIGVAGMLGAFLVSLLTTDDGTVGLKEKAQDPYFWIVWVVIFAIAMTVVMITYKTTKKDAKENDKFVATLKYYKEQKDVAMPHIDLLPDFCNKKNREIYTMIEREVVESADLKYDDFKAGKYDINSLEKWQIKRLKLVKDIKIKKLRSRELTQEYSYSKSNAYSFLPQDEKSNEKSFMTSKVVNRAINTFAFLLVGSLTFSADGWVSAITNSLGILFAWFGAVISANDYVNNELRNRYISKGDLLAEFNSTINNYIQEEKENDKDNNNDSGVPIALGEES